MANVDFPLDHAVQIKYNASGQEVSRETVYSGIVKCGYEKRTGSEAIFNYDEVPHYRFELWFSVPSDAYKYFTRTSGVFSNETIDYETHNYYGWYNTSDPWGRNYWREDTSGSRSFYNLGSAYTRFQPSDIIVAGANNERITLYEADFHKIQDGDCDYLVMTVYGDVISYLTSEQVGNTVYLQSRTTLFSYDITDLKLTFALAEVLTNVEPVYPVDVYASNSANLTVAWNISNTVNRNSSYLYPVSSTVTVADAYGHSLTETITGTDTSCVFTTTQLASLAVGQCSASVSVTDNYGNVATKTWTFNLVGESTAPEITYVTNQGFPRISWSISSQSGFEIKISNDSGVVYESGLVSGSSRYFVATKMMNHGKYSVEMRCLNEYGIFTAWASYYWEYTRDAGQYDVPLNVSARPDLGILVKNPDQWIMVGALYVIRRKDENSEPEILGSVSAFEKTFIDYTLGLNDPHQYAFRFYNTMPDFQGGGGYSDSHWVDGVLAYDGIVIRDAEDYSKFVHVWMSENRTINYIHDDNRSDTLVQCIGRKFPVSERGEWQTSVRSFSGFVSDEDFSKLKSMKLNSSHVLMQAQKEFFPCHMEYSDNGDYINGGRILSFQMTRIDGDK